ncbi:unnamed protein product [Choristocarpus tenellus]|uniref:ribosomal protein S2 n=1 Tax=Choristocarpus tenellus TaxID=116065 RepID=UPI002E789426|nr:ribosomal protein S2 [Choristocarpus tenellus]WBP69800.1 ribosomal protein S2 [Choristocarpus tenellus]
MKTKFIKHKSLFQYLIKKKAYIGPPLPYLDCSLYPFLHGKINHFSIYDLQQSLFILIQVLKLVEKLISDGGKILFVGPPKKFIKSIHYIPGISVCSKCVSDIRSSTNIDLIIIYNVNSKILYEAKQKGVPIVGFGGLNFKYVDYPVSLNFNDKNLFKWHIYLLVQAIIRGFNIRF